MSTEKDETYTIIVKGKMLASIKADLIHAFLSVRHFFFILNKLKTIYKTVTAQTGQKGVNFTSHLAQSTKVQAYGRKDALFLKPL